MRKSTTLLQSIAGRVMTSRRITRGDQQLLMSLIVHGHNEADNLLINQIHEELRRGIIRVVE